MTSHEWLNQPRCFFRADFLQWSSHKEIVGENSIVPRGYLRRPACNPARLQPKHIASDYAALWSHAMVNVAIRLLAVHQSERKKNEENSAGFLCKVAQLLDRWHTRGFIGRSYETQPPPG
jgi:hypothetical protein